MKKVIRKIFFVWQFDKEEKWLNEQAAKGLQLCRVGFFKYTFEEGLPGEYIYRLELLDKRPTHKESVQYIQFLEDTGARHIATYMNWVYFCKKAGAGGFDLFSDNSSRVRHLNRIIFLMWLLAGVNLFNGINNICLWQVSVMHSTLPISLLCFAVSLLLLYGILRLFSKRSKLKKEMRLHE